MPCAPSTDDGFDAARFGVERPVFLAAADRFAAAGRFGVDFARLLVRFALFVAPASRFVVDLPRFVAMRSSLAKGRPR